MLIRNRTVPRSWGTPLMRSGSATAAGSATSLSALFNTIAAAAPPAAASGVAAKSDKEGGNAKTSNTVIDDLLQHQHRGLLEASVGSSALGLRPDKQLEQQEELVRERVEQQQPPSQQKQQEEEHQQQQPEPSPAASSLRPPNTSPGEVPLLPPALFRWSSPPLTKEEFAALPTRIRTEGDHQGCVQCTDLVRTVGAKVMVSALGVGAAVSPWFPRS
jgi:hypothetical protein